MKWFLATLVVSAPAMVVVFLNEGTLTPGVWAKGIGSAALIALAMAAGLGGRKKTV